MHTQHAWLVASCCSAVLHPSDSGVSHSPQGLLLIFPGSLTQISKHNLTLWSSSPDPQQLCQISCCSLEALTKSGRSWLAFLGRVLHPPPIDLLSNPRCLALTVCVLAHFFLHPCQRCIGH